MHAKAIKLYKAAYCCEPSSLQSESSLYRVILQSELYSTKLLHHEPSSGKREEWTPQKLLKLADSGRMVFFRAWLLQGKTFGPGEEILANSPVPL